MSITIKISRPGTKVEGKNGAYFRQTGTVQLKGRDGLEEETRRKVEFFYDSELKPGEYEIDFAASLRVGQYDKLEFGRLVLSPAPKVQGTAPGK